MTVFFADNEAVIATLPPALTAVSMTGPGWSCASLTCKRSDALNAGSSYQPITLTVNVDPNSPSTVISEVAAFGGGGAPVIVDVSQGVR
jgi:hypothetical protein